MFFIREWGDKLFLSIAFLNYTRSLKIPSLFFVYLVLGKSRDVTFCFSVPSISGIVSFISIIIAFLYLSFVDALVCLIITTLTSMRFILLVSPGRKLYSSSLFWQSYLLLKSTLFSSFIESLEMASPNLLNSPAITQIKLYLYTSTIDHEQWFSSSLSLS